MAMRLFCGLTALALAAFTTGCASTGETIRGQSPAGVRNAGYGGPLGGQITQAGACGSCPSGACGPAGNGGDCGPQCGFGQSGPCGAGMGMNLPCNPVHRNYYNVRMPNPQELRYPAPNTPMAVVQYPYYTTKGPSDFFMK